MTDLANKKVYIPGQGGPPEILTRYVLKEHGVLEEVEFVYSSVPEIMQLLASEKIEFAVLPEPVLSGLRVQRGDLIEIIDYEKVWQAMFNESLPQTGMFVNRQWAEKNPEAVEQFQKAYEEAVSITISEPSKAISVSVEVFGLPEAILAEAMNNIHLQFVKLSMPSHRLRGISNFLYRKPQIPLEESCLMRIFITVYNRFPASIAILSLLFLWGALSSFYPPVVLPSPVNTLETLSHMLGTKSFWESLGITLYRLIVGFFIALVSGTALGLLFGSNEKLYKLSRPFVMVLQSIPPISWILLAVIWFGINGGAQITVVILSLFPIFFFHLAQGIREVSKELLEMARIYRVGLLKTILSIYLPSLKPFWLSAMMITIGNGWKTVVMSEVISGQTGIGAVMNTSRLYLKTDEIMAWTLVIACLGISTEMIIRKISGGIRRNEA